MKTLLIIWRASFRSSINTLREDGRMRIGILLALAIQMAAGVWTWTRLLPAFADWQPTNMLPAHLWLTCLVAWSSIALFSVLATFQAGLNSNEALLLATQPIVPSTRLRALYGLVLLKGGGNWLLWEAGVLGVALAPILGWSVLTWLALLIVGAVLVAWLALVATLLVLRFVIPHLRVCLGLGIGLISLSGLLLLILRNTGWSSSPGIVGTPVPPSPELVWPGMLLLILIALLPMAHTTGQLYLSTLLISQNHTGATNALMIPGMRLLLAQLTRSRSMTAALLYKGLLNQSRHLLAWTRLLVLVIMIALFAPIRAAAYPLHLPLSLLIASYATGLAALMLIEYAPYTISSEGNRLALYLVIPRGLSGFLRARLCSFLLPALSIGLLSALLIGLWSGLSPLDLGAALLVVLFMLCGYTTFTVLGSTLDEDLSLAIEDRTQALMQEELPITPRRLQLLGLTIGLLAGLLLLTWKLPIFLALPTLVLIDGAIALVMWRLSTAYIARLLR